jgi:heme-degrading monooxygenase HmoA
MEHADEFLEFLNKSGIPDCKNVPGYLGVQMWRRKEQGVCHFWTVTHWNRVDSIKHFADENHEKAPCNPEARHYLPEFEPHVQHFETFEFWTDTFHPSFRMTFLQKEQ